MGTIFCLVPDLTEVNHAIEILKMTCKGETQAFTSLEGIPLFHPISLEVKSASGKIKATPFFLDKDDADFASEQVLLGDKNRLKNSTQLNLKEIESEIFKISSHLQKAIESKNAKLELKQRKRINIAINQLEKTAMRTKKSNFIINRPIIEVSCLEWVIREMKE